MSAHLCGSAEDIHAPDACNACLRIRLTLALDENRKVRAEVERIKAAMCGLRPACTGCEHLLHDASERDCGAEDCNCGREHRKTVALYAEVRWDALAPLVTEEKP